MGHHKRVVGSCFTVSVESPKLNWVDCRGLKELERQVKAQNSKTSNIMTHPNTIIATMKQLLALFNHPSLSLCSRISSQTDNLPFEQARNKKLTGLTLASCLSGLP